MKNTLGFLAASLTLASSAMAADVFVNPTRGADLSRAQISEVTGLVKNAVRGMTEHQLVNKPSDADFVLQPSVLTRGDEMVLRIEKVKDGQILAMSEEKINSVDASRSRAMAVTEAALQDDSTTAATDDDGGTASATTVGADDTGSSAGSTTGMESQGAIDLAPSHETQTIPAQRSIQSVQPSQTTATTTTPPPAGSANTGYTPASPGAKASVAELTAPSPRLISPDRAGQFQLGVGPSFGIGMQTDSPMYDFTGAYAVDLSDNVVGKIFGDLNLGTGSESARFLNFGVAGEYYPAADLLTFGKTYIGGDLGYAFARNSKDQTADNVAAGVGAGFKFQASDLNWDVNAHYTLLLDRIASSRPSVFGVRVALGF